MTTSSEKLKHVPEKPKVAVHKFSSCDGCQLQLLNDGASLIQLSQLVEFVHFAEAGPVNPDVPVDVAIIEGSVSTPDELERIQRIRDNAQYVITIGACATAGGIQALRNGRNVKEWIAAIYAHPEFIDTLDTATPIAAHVKVDFEIWGCPVNGAQVYETIRTLLYGAEMRVEHDSVCVECKRNGNPCVMVTDKTPCMGPVTRTGCGALCPSVGRGCYACFGPTTQINSASLINRFAGFGLTPDQIARKFLFINNQPQPFQDAATLAKEGSHE